MRATRDMVNAPKSDITVVTYPDYNHNSDYKITLVLDTPQLEPLLDVVEKFNKRVSITCITHDVTDFNWIASSVNQSNFVFVSNCSKLDKMILGWILGRKNVFHNIEQAQSINTKYTIELLTSFIQHIDNMEV
tara:strand:- start:6385 stop:6783 length:399 start_codon:yes stop_codon:yes gene_type:complete